MKKLLLILAISCISSVLSAQDNRDLENKFYIRFGVSTPTNAYIGLDDSFWDETSRIGGILELGSIFIINSLDLADGLRLGINVDYADFSYHQISSDIDDSAIGVFKVSSKVGPSISYCPIPKLVFDGYVKFKLSWVAGMAFAESDGTVNDEGYAGTLGTGYAIGINVRYKILMLGFEFNTDKMKLEHTDFNDEYLGNAKDDSDKTPLPCMNFTFGFNF